MKMFRSFDVEISANSQHVVIDDAGRAHLAKTFGGRVSRSGATIWPEWVEERAVAIKPLSLISSDDIAGENVICFSGGGLSRVRIYSARSIDVEYALQQWRRWRGFNPPGRAVPEMEEINGRPAMRCRLPRQFDLEPMVSTDAQWIARAASLNESRNVEGTRLTDHEVSRYAQELSIKWDADSNAMRWTAAMKWRPWEATAMDHGNEPKAWTLYEKAPSPGTEGALEYDDFIEAEVDTPA